VKHWSVVFVFNNDALRISCEFQYRPCGAGDHPDNSHEGFTVALAANSGSGYLEEAIQAFERHWCKL